MSVEYPRLSGTVGLDLENCDPDLKTHGPGWPFPGRGFIAGFAFAWGPPGQREKRYFPIRHEAGGNLPLKGTLRWLGDTLKQTGLTVVVHNALYELGWLRREGVALRCNLIDTNAAAPILDEYRFSYKLDALGKDYLGRGKNEEALMAYGLGRKILNPKGTGRMIKEFRNKGQVKANMWRFHADTVSAYGADDAELALDLWDVFRPALEAEDLMRLYRTEMRLFDILVEMRWRGVRVATDAVEQAVKKMSQQEAVWQKELDTLAGFHVSVNQEETLAKLFREVIGITPLQTPTGKDSFRKDWIDDIDHRGAKLVRLIRSSAKSRGTFLEGYVLHKQVRGRVHGQFHPQKSDEGGAVTGRFSASDPNLQNLPARDKEIKKLVRGAFLPEEGAEWAACDYSQQEPRLMVHFAVKGKIRGARKAQRAYVENPDMDYHQFMADLTGIIRHEVKPINLGIGYGMGGAKLCRALGFPTIMKEIRDRDTGKLKTIEIAGPEGQRVLDLYHDNAPFVKGLMDDCTNRAKRRGYVRTLLGRRARLSNGAKGWGRQDWFYKAMNRLVQGSAADQTKLAIIACWDAGHVPLVLVHDELGFSLDDRGKARQIRELMEHCVELEVPSKVDVELGPSWGLAAEQLKSEQEDDAIDWAAV